MQSTREDMLKQVKDGVELRLKVTPRSSKNAIIGWEGDILKVRLRAIPEKGNANDALIELLAEFFDVAPSQISLAGGYTSRIKKVVFTRITLSALAKKLLPLKTE